MFRFENIKYKNILDISKLNISSHLNTIITGPSGVGKTTMMMLMNKMISPDSGKIYYNGKDLSQINSVFHRREVMMLSQSSIIVQGTIRDNLAIGFSLQEKPIPSDEILKNVLISFGKLNKSLDDSAQVLSGGEQQRVALARVVLLNPVVFLLDEPTASLDGEVAFEILDHLCEYAKQNGKTIIMVTHDENVAKRYVQQQIIFDEHHHVEVVL